MKSLEDFQVVCDRQYGQPIPPYRLIIGKSAPRYEMRFVVLLDGTIVTPREYDLYCKTVDYWGA